MGRFLGCAESAVLFSGKPIGLQILRFCHGNVHILSIAHGVRVIPYYIIANGVHNQENGP